MLEPIQFRRTTLATCEREATGVVVVIDVLRAFTTAAFALAGGADRIWLAGTVAEAVALQAQRPDALLLGEVDGVRPPRFDLGNSPHWLQQADVRGRLLIQRTSAGTQGVLRSRRADALLAASFVVAGATIAAIRQLAPAVVSFVITGEREEDDGDEDAALADYLEATLTGRAPEPAPYLRRVRASANGRRFAAAPVDDPSFPPADLACATDLDRFDFALPVRVTGGRHELDRPASLPAAPRES